MRIIIQIVEDGTSIRLNKSLREVLSFVGGFDMVSEADVPSSSVVLPMAKHQVVKVRGGKGYRFSKDEKAAVLDYVARLPRDKRGRIPRSHGKDIKSKFGCSLETVQKWVRKGKK